MRAGLHVRANENLCGTIGKIEVKLETLLQKAEPWFAEAEISVAVDGKKIMDRLA